MKHIGCVAIVCMLPWSMSIAPRAQTAAPAPAPTASTQAAPAVLIESLSWMVGAWTGKMGRAGIEEHWIPPAGKTMMAVARTVVGDRTVAFEFLRLEQRPDGI